MRTPLTYQQAGGGHTVAVPVCRRCGGSQRLHSGGTGALSRQRCARPASSGWRPVRRALGFPSEKICGNRARSHRQLTRRPGTRLASPRGRRDTRARARPEVGPGSRQAALKSGVTAPQVGWALPSRAGDPRPAPKAPYGRFLINSRDSPEPGSGREPGEPPRRSAAGCVRQATPVGELRPGRSTTSRLVGGRTTSGAITVVTTRLEVPMADLRGLPGSSTEKWRWQRHGACRGANPELFFHPDGKRGPSSL